MSQQTPAGWYPQPDGTQRYWDGLEWTNHVAPSAGAGPTPPNMAQPQPAPTPSAAAKPWFKKKRVIIPVGVLGALIAIGATQGGGGGQAAVPPPAASSPTVEPSSKPAEPEPTAPATESPAEQPVEEPAEPEEPAVEPAPTLGNGDHIVGVDIQAGVYRAEVETSVIELCTVSQSKADGDIMDIRNANEGSVIFTVVKKKDSVVSFSGCGLIAPAADVLRKNPKEITNGDWLVKSELKAGKYQGVVDTDSAFQLGTISQTSAKGDIMDIRNANEGKVVFTVKNAKGSVISFNGFKSIKKVG